MSNAVVLLAGLLPLTIVRFSVLGIPTNLFELGVWIVAGITLFEKALRKTTIPLSPSGERVIVRAIPKTVLIFIALFILSAIISTAISPITRSSLGILKGWIVTPMLFGFLVHTTAGKHLVIRSFILSGLVVALFGLSQMHGFNRIYSLYDVPNSLALFLVPIAVLTVWIGIKENNRPYQLFSIPILIAIIATQSMGAVIALVGTFAITLFIYDPTSPPLIRGEEIDVFSPSYEGEPLPEAGVGVRKGKRMKYSVLIVTIFLLITTAFFTLSGRFSYLISPILNSNTTNSVTVRLQLWDIGIDLIKQHPILGIGLGQFEPAYQAELHRRLSSQANATLPAELAGVHYKLQPEYVFRDPHNWIIAFWLNTGLLGLISFIGLNYVAIKKGVSPPHMRGSRPLQAGGGGRERETIYSQAIALALISILIFGLFDTIYWKNDLSALWWMLILLSNE